jgi:DNA-binding FrmR family transcriptional regulator
MRREKDMATTKNMLKQNAREERLCSHDADLAGRKAAAVDPGIKASNLRRLRRIEGQIRGLQRMVEEDRYCADILTQVSSAQEALRAVARALMRNHLTHCAADAIRLGSAEERQAMYDELLEMIYKNAR